MVLAAFVVIAAFAAGGAVRAQDATPSPMMGPMVSHPAHIHTGACATLGGIAYPLNDVAAPGSPMTMMGTPVMGTPMAMLTPAMAANATPMVKMGMVVAESVTTVKVSLADLEKAPFAINIHESLPKISNYIACGDITGTAIGGALTVELNQLNNSGLAGMATLKDNGDGTTTVSVQLMQPLA